MAETPTLEDTMATALSTDVREVAASNPMAMLAQVCSNPEIDPDRLDKFMALYERQRAWEAEVAFAEAMSACKAELPAVVRDKKNTHTNSRYASLEAVAERIDPVISKHGFSISFNQDKSQLPDHILLVATVTHKAGHSRVHSLDLPLDSAGAKGNTNKTDIQAMGSTVSYGRRYLKLMIFDVSVADQDNDGNRATETIDAKQFKILSDLFKLHDADLPLFLQWAGIDDLCDLPKSKYGEAVALVRRKPLRSTDTPAPPAEPKGDGTLFADSPADDASY